MDRLRLGRLCRLDDLLADQVAFACRRRPDMHRLVGHPHMQRLGIRIRINRDRPHAELPRGADDPAGDLAAVCDEEGLDHRKSSPDRGGGPATGWWRGPTSAQVATIQLITASISFSTS